MDYTLILDFWFSDIARSKWFASTPEFDQQIRDQFELVWQQASRGELDGWAETADGALALAIVLDQLPLNMYRGEALSFSTEAKAIAISKRAIKAGLDKALPQDKLAFLYMPLMHSEDIEDQKLSVQMFDAAGLTENARFARHHMDLIERFRRFPHRNEILGRESTAEEVEYLNSKQAFKG